MGATSERLLTLIDSQGDAMRQIIVLIESLTIRITNLEQKVEKYDALLEIETFIEGDGLS